MSDGCRGTLEQFTCPDCGAAHLQPEIDRAKFFMFRQPRCVPCQAAWDQKHPPAITLSMTTRVVAVRREVGVTLPSPDPEDAP